MYYSVSAGPNLRLNLAGDIVASLAASRKADRGQSKGIKHGKEAQARRRGENMRRRKCRPFSLLLTLLRLDDANWMTPSFINAGQRHTFTPPRPVGATQPASKMTAPCHFPYTLSCTLPCACHNPSFTSCGRIYWPKSVRHPRHQKRAWRLTQQAPIDTHPINPVFDRRISRTGWCLKTP